MKQINTNLLHNPATEPFPTVNEDVCVNRRALPPLINIYSRSFGRDLGAGADHTPVRGACTWQGYDVRFRVCVQSLHFRRFYEKVITCVSEYVS